MKKPERIGLGLTKKEKDMIADAVHGLKLWKEKVQKWQEAYIDMMKRENEAPEEAKLEGYRRAEKVVDSFLGYLLKPWEGTHFTPSVKGAAYNIRDTIRVLGMELKWVKKTWPEKTYSAMYPIAEEFVRLFDGFLDRAEQYGYDGGRIYLSDAMKEGD